MLLEQLLSQPRAFLGQGDRLRLALRAADVPFLVTNMGLHNRSALKNVCPLRTRLYPASLNSFFSLSSASRCRSGGNAPSSRWIIDVLTVMRRCIWSVDGTRSPVALNPACS